MIIKFNPNTVTPFGFSKSSESIIYSLESVSDNIVKAGVFSESDLNNRGNISELANKVTLSGSNLNKVSCLSSLQNILAEKGLLKDQDYTIIQSLSWDADINLYPIRITLDKDYVLQYLTEYIEVEKAKGYPVIYNTTTVVLYVSQILSDHRTLLENTSNAFIEE